MLMQERGARVWRAGSQEGLKSVAWRKLERGAEQGREEGSPGGSSELGSPSGQVTAGN